MYIYFQEASDTTGKNIKVAHPQTPLTDKQVGLLWVFFAFVEKFSQTITQRNCKANHRLF